MRPYRTHAAPRRPRWRAAVLPSAIVALTGAWISGCSVLYSLDTAQCSTSADCEALGGAFTGLVCVENLCQEPEGCDSNAECIDGPGNGIEPYACIERSCVSLRTTECPQLLPLYEGGGLTALRDDNPVILAGTGLIEDAGEKYDIFLKNYDLALTELNSTVGGVNQGTRPLVMLGCQATFQSSGNLDAMMTFLTETVRVPAMIPAMSAEDLLHAFTTYGQRTNTFFMSPLESDPALGNIGDSGLVWHVGAGADSIARAYAPLLTRTLAHLGVNGTVRVATVVGDNRFMVNMVSAITASPADHGIVFNDMGALANGQAGNYREFTTQDLTDTVLGLIAFRPHVILSATDRPFLTDIVTGVESGWGESSGQAKPFYILSPINYNDSVGLNAALNGNATLRTRLVGVNPAAAEDNTNYLRYLTSYESVFDVRDAGYENFYDAAYYLMYAIGAVATQDTLRTGEAIPSGMRRLIGTTDNPYDVGTADLPNALAQVASGATIQLDGTMGPPSWNGNGTRNMPGSVYCIDVTNNYRPDVLRYRETTPNDASSAILEGDFTCFDFGPATP
jgi:hypothetical protein